MTTQREANEILSRLRVAVEQVMEGASIKPEGPAVVEDRGNQVATGHTTPIQDSSTAQVCITLILAGDEPQ